MYTGTEPKSRFAEEFSGIIEDVTSTNNNKSYERCGSLITLTLKDDEDNLSRVCIMGNNLANAVINGEKQKLDTHIDEESLVGLYVEKNSSDFVIKNLA